MDLQKFDSTLKSALDNIEVPFDPSTWAALEQKLELLPAPDAVDKALRPSLERLETSYDAGSWPRLASRMDGLSRVRRLRMTKLAEAAIFLLLLLNLQGFFGAVKSVTNPAPSKQAVPGPIAKAQISKPKNLILKTIATPSSEETKDNQGLAAQVLAFVQEVASVFSLNSQNGDNNTAANAPQPIASNASLLDPKSFYGQSGLMKFPLGSTLPPQVVEPILYAGSTISIPGIEIPKVVKPSRFYAATFASFDKNYVREGDFSDKKNGYGGGFAVGYRKGKWGIETGLAYSQKSYQPKEANVAYQNDPVRGFSLYNIDQVDADVFSVPVKVTRRVAKVGKASAHVLVGMAVHFATNKNYDFKTLHYPQPPSPNNPIPIASLPNGKGVLENGGLAHNAYATADLGIRVEQPLGRHYVAFVEPSYRRSLGGGFGPNTARINTFSLQAGVMASL